MSKKGSIILIALTMASAFGIIVGSALSSSVSQARLQKRVVATIQARQIANSAMVVAIRSLRARIDSGEQLDGQNFTIDQPDPNLFGPTTYRLSQQDAKLVQTTLAQTSQITLATPTPMPSKSDYFRSAATSYYTQGGLSVYRTRDPILLASETIGIVRNIDVYLKADIKLGGVTFNAQFKQTLADRFYNSARLIGSICYPDIELVSNTLDTPYCLYCMSDLYVYPIGSGSPFSMPPHTLVAGNIYRKPVFPTTNLTPRPVNAYYGAYPNSTASISFPLTLDSTSATWTTQALKTFGGSIRDGKLGVLSVPLEGFGASTYVPAYKSSDGQKRNPFYQLIQPLIAQQGNNLTTDPLFKQKFVSSAKCFFRVSNTGSVKFFIADNARNEQDVTSALPPGIIGTAAQDYTKVATDLVMEQYAEETTGTDTSQQLADLITNFDTTFPLTGQGYTATGQITPQTATNVMAILNGLPNPPKIPGPYYSINDMIGSIATGSTTGTYGSAMFSDLKNDLIAVQSAQSTSLIQPSGGGSSPGVYVKSGIYDTRQDLSMSLVTLDLEAFRQALINRTFGPAFNQDLYYSGVLYVEFPTPPPPSTRPDGVIVASSNTMALQVINCKNMQMLCQDPNHAPQLVAVVTNAPMYVVGDVNPAMASGPSGSSNALPCYFIADSFTFLSKAWNNQSRRYSKMSIDTQEVYAVRTAAASILGANIIAGITPTPRDSSNLYAFSGGFPWGIIRSLEAWTGSLGGSSPITLQVAGAVCCFYESELQTKPLGRVMNNPTYKYMGQLPRFYQTPGWGTVGRIDIFPIFHSYRATSSRYVSTADFNNL